MIFSSACIFTAIQAVKSCCWKLLKGLGIDLLKMPKSCAVYDIVKVDDYGSFLLQSSFYWASPIMESDKASEHINKYY